MLGVLTFGFNCSSYSSCYFGPPNNRVGVVAQMTIMQTPLDDTTTPLSPEEGIESTSCKGPLSL